MMATKKSGRKKEQWVRSFTVSDPVTHPKGFTIYKVKYIGFVINKPEEIIEITVWKRYNDFKKLYKALLTIHQQMRRPETFPTFAKAKLFGRFDEEVIEERRKSTLKLLEFAATKSYLVNSQYFVMFFEGGENKITEEKKPVEKNILVPEILTPEALNKNPSEAIERSQSNSGANSPSLGQQMSEDSSSNLGGVWLHRQEEGDDPLAELQGLHNDNEHTSYDDDDDDRTTFSEDSVPSTPLPQVQDISFFDPLTDVDLPSESKDGLMSHSSSWLFEAMDMCAGLQNETKNDSLPPSSTETPSNDGITLNFSSHSENHQATDYADAPQSNQTKASDTSKDVKTNTPGANMVPETRRDDHHAKSMARAYLNCIRAQQAAERDEQLGVHGGIVDSRNAMVQQLPIGVQNDALHDIASRDRTTTNLSIDSVSAMDLGGEDDYLYKAASQIKLAIENEATGNYKSAFTYYKTGVNVLLQGVVTDNNNARREAVRRKTAQYLMKAEDLYKKFLSAEAANANCWNSDKFHMDIDHNSIHLRGSIDDLKNFKVLGIINSVLLVLDMVSYQMFVIKVLQKCAVLSRKRKTCVPVKCRFMVQLCQYFETENAIYLVIEHATGGKLWDYVSGYLRQEEDALSKQSFTTSLDRSRTSSRGSKRSRGNSVPEEIPINEPLVEDVFDSKPHENNKQNTANRVEGRDACNLNSMDQVTHTTETSPIPDNIQDCASSYVDLVSDYTQKIQSPVEKTISDTVPSTVSDFSVISDTMPSTIKSDLSFSDTIPSTVASEFSVISDTMPSTGASEFSLISDVPSTIASDFSMIEDSEDTGLSSLIEKSLQYDDNLLTETDDVSTNDYHDSSLLPAKDITPESQPPPISLFSIDSVDSDYSSPDNMMNGNKFSFSSDRHNSGRTLDDIPEVKNATKNNAASRKLDFDGYPDEEVFEVKEQVDNSVNTQLTSTFKSGLFMDDIDDDLPITRDSFIHKTPDTSGFASVMDSSARSSKSSSIDGDSSELLQSVEVSSDSKETNEEDFLVIDLVENSAINSNDIEVNLSTQRPILQTQTSKSNLNVSGMGKGCFPGIDNDNQSDAKNGEDEVITKDLLNYDSPKDDESFSVFVNPFEKYDSSEPNGIVNKPHFKTWVNIDDSPNRKPSVTIPKGIPTPDCSPTKKTPTTPLDSNTNTFTFNTKPKDVEKTNMENDSSVGDKTLTRTGDIDIKGTAFSRDRTMSVLFENLDRDSSRGSVTLPESCVRVWIAEILLALEDLHSMGIICRDLNPSNILLGERGHIRLSYFSIWQYVDDDVNESALENLYCAPEVNGIYKVTPACDWWSLGALLFELLTGKPLHNCHPSGINSHTELKIPDHVSKEAKSLLKQLLLVNSSERLGSGIAGVDDIKIHPFFRDINWKTISS